ncbi:L-type lectin-domain containing receptor kinase IV.1-like [Coffea eugenioides]|uniref:L-type lectin-domain containing receptor kinase IV.1-like n=1 Tax=Coffea eugenioides TaxID=49369 RepID=UPI000F5D3463|nr:L-type lectin-domain containing receptor kinase IV.1-like [Coffea arabica]XP_027159064.1 L-type lectin-domain containing receptor kinase IV.1-like [Coffea eugenioides]
MFILIKLILLAVSALAGFASSQDLSITYNGFRSSDLSRDGIAEVTPNGLLKLTDAPVQQQGHAFFPNPVSFKDSANSSAFSFSTTFIFAVVSEYPTLSGHGMAFVIAPTRGLPGALPSHHLGLFNETNNGNETNHVFAVELDTIQSEEFHDINNNHVGIDINGLNSTLAEPAGYYSDGSGVFQNLTLISGKAMQVWVEYDGKEKHISVTLAPIYADKPNKPLLSLSYDLSPILNKNMYIGFSSSTGSVPTSHCLLGWSFKMNGVAQWLDLSQLPKLPRVGPKKTSKVLTIGLPIILTIALPIAISGIIYQVRIKKKFAEVLEDWEHDYGPHRFKYKDLYIATKRFRDRELLGRGGFGKVYRGILPSSKLEVAVKRVSHDSRQGMKEFVAEIVSIGRLRHRNLVPLLGYCRRKDELLLVYEYMPNGSLDRFLYQQPRCTLNWNQRYRVIRGVASGLFYLHEGWEQIVIHRDVKASNVLLDSELNGRLGDFGLAKLYDHGTDPQTTHVVGTLGYLAPEHTRTGKATTRTDVYAFGAFLLEVVCGRRPIEPHPPTEDAILVDWVFSCWNKGQFLEAVDPNMGLDYVKEEVELVMKLGLLCSQSEPTARPTMRQVVLYLDSALALPDLRSLGISATGLSFASQEGFSDFKLSYPSSMDKPFSHASSSAAESLLSGGR